MLNRDQIIAAVEKPAGRLTIEEWGGEIGIRHLTVAEVAALRETQSGDDTLDGIARFAAMLICDESGGRIFQDDDIEALKTRGLDILMRIAEAGRDLNGMTEKAREELRKN